MTSEIMPYALICLAGVFLSAISQAILKKAAMKPHGSILEEYLNPQVIIAYLMFFGTTLISVWAYRGIPLSMGPVLETTGYIYITLFGVFLFKETINAKKIAALALIICGIVVYALG